ncbi:phenylalanine--tRNA ligase subunit beta [Patescibacteria group bacterium]|nr:phenylalanine--tRNA ligase subunit beta [Patescibacteria group bacterium]
MNILVSYNWIKEYLKTNLSPEEFAKEMSAKSMSVETIDRLRDRFANMVVGVVKELKAHPGADKLRLAEVDIGREVVEIVCGGKNLAIGMRVLVALPGAQVRWHGEGELITLEKATIRGVESFGMICAPSEVGFDKAYCPEGGIWDLSELTEAKPGTDFVGALDMDDVIFDMEVTSNRPDAMCIVGLAREAAAATGDNFEFDLPLLPEASGDKKLEVNVKDSDLCPRYMAVVIDGVRVGPSPAWLQKKLLLAGHRPINNIVDITNYILHEYGQPLHTFDYTKLTDQEINIRRAKDGEKFLALDEKEYELTSDNLVIADSTRPVAVAGVMGGQDSGTWDGTTTIVFEAATFDPVSVRRTSRALNLYSDSQLLFEKGLSSQSPAIALAKAIELTLELAGGQVASRIFDEQKEDYKPLIFDVRPDKIRQRIGVEISDEEIERILTTLGFTLDKVEDHYRATVPFWRDHDIEDEVDFSEEVARMYGYDNLPSVLPSSPPPITMEEPSVFWEHWFKNKLSSAGYTEFYSYSFVSARDLEKYDLDPAEAVSLFNPLSSDLTHMRTSLMPSLLSSIELNQREVSQDQVFELSRIYLRQENDLPDERLNLTISHFGINDIEQALLKLKGVLEMIADQTGFDLSFERVEDNIKWHPTRSAKILADGQEIGMLGQVAEAYTKAFGIDRPVAAVEIDLEKLIPRLKLTRHYQPIPEYPAIVRDIAVGVEEKTAFFEIAETIKEQSPMIESVMMVEVYRGPGLAHDVKSLTLSITLRAPNRTLSSEDADEVMNRVRDTLKEKFQAVLR